MLSVNPTSIAHHFTTLSGREVFVVDGQAGFDLEALVAACHSASCRPPTSGGTGGSISVQHVATKANAEAILKGGFRLDTPEWDRSFGNGVYFALAGDQKSAKFYARQGGREWRDAHVVHAEVQLKNPLTLTGRTHAEFRNQLAEAMGGKDAVMKEAEARYNEKLSYVQRVLHEEFSYDNPQEYARVSKELNGFADPTTGDLMKLTWNDKFSDGARQRASDRIEETLVEMYRYRPLIRNYDTVMKRVPNNSDNWPQMTSVLANMARDRLHLDGIIVHTKVWGGVGGEQVVVFDPATVTVQGAHPYANIKGVTASGEEFACHDASCRPPTAGGTGGSKPSAFGQRIRDAIAGEAVLADLTVAHNAEKHATITERQNKVNQEDLIDNIKSGSWLHLRVEPVARASYSSEANKALAHARVMLQKDVDSLNHARFVDPNYVPHTDFERQFYEVAQRRINGDHSEAVMMLESEDHKFRVVIPATPWRKPDLDQTMVTPHHERASTRIGAIVRQEIVDRIAKFPEAELIAHHQEVMKKIMELAGPDAKFEIYPGRTQTSARVQQTFQKRADGTYEEPLTFEVGVQIERLAAEAGIRHSNLTTFLRIAHNRFARETIIDVVKEARSVGGTIDGTPRHRAVKNGGLSSNEQITKALELYPTEWINASNAHGPVTFRQTTGRAHYRHATGEITLDGDPTVAAHELGHRFESTVPGLLALEAQFMLRRTNYKPVLQKLQKLVPGARYGDKEVADPDHFFDPYVGKSYMGSAYEVVSMGMQYLPDHLGRSVRKAMPMDSMNPIMDEDYMDFMLGAMVTVYR